MSTLAFLGAGTQVQLGNGASPEVFTTIAEVTSQGELGQENDLKEATHMQSTAKEYIYGLADGVELPVTCNYIPANAQQVASLAANAAKTTKNFKVILPPAGGSLAFSFAAIIKSWKLAIVPNEIVSLVLGLKVSGAITGPV